MIDLRQGDCLELMGDIEPSSIDLVLCDLPYGVTSCRWDQVIPFEPLWAHYKRVLKPRGAVVLTAAQPFTSMLVMSNREWFRYDDVWDKVQKSGFLDANRRPLRRHQTVLVFSPSGRFTYRPMMRTGPMVGKRGVCSKSDCYGSAKERLPTRYSDQYYPTSIISISSPRQTGKQHPTQKPVALMEYLIKTYSNEGETILDNCFGSGTTGVACLNTNRSFIGIERDPGYFAIAQKRIAEAELPMFAS